MASPLVGYQPQSRLQGLQFRVRESPDRDPPAPSLAQKIRAVARMRRLKPRTEQAYAGWIRRFLAYHGGRHPLEPGKGELEDFLSDLAVRGKVSASTQNQAFSALLFLYRDVYGQGFPWLEGVVRARRPKRLPVVLTREEVSALLGQMPRSTRLMASLLYGSGLRLMECMSLRISTSARERSSSVTARGRRTVARCSRAA